MKPFLWFCFAVYMLASSTTQVLGQSQNYVAKFNAGGSVINSSVFDNGNVGIGTTSPAATLDVNGDAIFRTFRVSLSSSLSNGPQLRLFNAAVPNQADWTFGVPGVANSTSVFVYDNVNHVAPFTVEQGATANALYLQSGGRVGIGTSAPGATLDVNGDFVFRSFAGYLTTGLNNGPQLRFANAATPTAANWTLGISGVANATSFMLYDNTTPSMPLVVEQGAAANSLYLRNGGNVGIGIAVPSQKLEVNGGLKLTTGSGGRIYFADGTSQTKAAYGTISGVLPGTGLTGGGHSGDVTLSVDSYVARTNGPNTFTSQQTFTYYPLLVNNTALFIDNELSAQYGVKSTVLSGIASQFWNKAWADTSWGTGSIIAGYAGSGQTQMFHVDTRGTTYTYNGYVAGGYDYAELVNVTGSLDTSYEPGDVLIIDPDGKSQFKLADKPYSTLVAGVYSG
jgi:hypothetical protein